MSHRWTRVFASERVTSIALTAVLAVALLAALGPLTSNRFHHDEAVYSSWGLDIASGRDVLVSGSPVDKPPVFLYVQALSFLLFGPTELAARLPSLIASLASVGLVFALGRLLYGRGEALLAAYLFAASPFVILFAPTAFTDPLMVTWVLAGCLAALRGYAARTGFFLGLAAITKQQGLFFLPLALGLLYLSTNESANLRSITAADLLVRVGKSRIVSFLILFLAVTCLAMGWDMARARQPGFLVQSLISYGGLSLSPGLAWANWLGFMAMLRYATGSPMLNWTLLLGLPLLLVLDILLVLGRSRALPARSDSMSRLGQARADLIIVIFVALFLAAHALVGFVVWDRYLLGLIPWLALLLARVLSLSWHLFKNSLPSTLFGVLAVLWALVFTLRPIRDAANSRFPIGGDHGAYQGIEQIVNYFQSVPADTTVYHRWLGPHWRFYLWGSPYDFRAWSSPVDLAIQAAARPGARRYIVFPSWRSSTEARLALAEVGLVMHEVQRAFRDDGSISFVVYRIEEMP